MRPFCPFCFNYASWVASPVLFSSVCKLREVWHVTINADKRSFLFEVSLYLSLSLHLPRQMKGLVSRVRLVPRGCGCCRDANEHKATETEVLYKHFLGRVCLPFSMWLFSKSDPKKNPFPRKLHLLLWGFGLIFFIVSIISIPSHPEWIRAVPTRCIPQALPVAPVWRQDWKWFRGGCLGDIA